MAEPKGRVTRRAFSIAEKFEIITKLERGVSQSELCTKMKLRKSTVSSIWKNKERVKNEYEKSGKIKKKMRMSSHNKIDQMLYDWYKKKIDEMPINGPMLQKTAEKFGKLIGDEFKCSSGWVDRFKKRHNIRFNRTRARRRRSDAFEVLTEEKWLSDEWQNIHCGYSNDNIFTIVETLLFYKEVDNKLQVTENCFEDDTTKDYLSLVVSANATGSEKRKPIVIAKFKNVETLPCTDYIRRRKTFTIMPFLEKWDEELKNLEHKRKIKILVDSLDVNDCLTFNNMELYDLGDNVGPISMTKAISWSIKDNFKKLLKSTESRLFTIQEVMTMAHEAWQQISAERIHDCFQCRCLLTKEIPFCCPNDCSYHSSGEETDETEQEDVPLHDWLVIKQATESNLNSPENPETITTNTALNYMKEIAHYFRVKGAPSYIFSHLSELTELLEKSIKKID